jgi:hypothetical protein
MNIQKLISEARSNPELLSTINIDELLDNLEIDESEYLETATLESTKDTVVAAINELPICEFKRDSFAKSLSNYRFVDQICDMRTNRYSRWVQLNNPEKLLRGGTVVDIKILKNIQILVKTHGPFHSFVTCIFDENVRFFQKLTDDEMLILMSNAYLGDADIEAEAEAEAEAESDDEEVSP